MQNEHKSYFSTDALAQFVAAEGKILQKVVCHLWQNTIDKSGTVELIDNIQLIFADGNILTISANNEGDGLDAIRFDYKKAASELKEEFGEKIRMFAVDASSTSMWEKVIGLPLKKIGVSKEGDYYLSDAVMLDFGDERREIKISPMDGIIIDYYED